MARKKITDSQIVCLILLWGLLCYLLLTYSKAVDFYVVFVIISSAIIVFVPIYKNRRGDKK